MRRQRKRTIGFLQTSDRLSKLFVDEIYARRALEMHVRQFASPIRPSSTLDRRINLQMKRSTMHVSGSSTLWSSEL